MRLDAVTMRPAFGLFKALRMGRPLAELLDERIEVRLVEHGHRTSSRPQRQSRAARKVATLLPDSVSLSKRHPIAVISSSFP